MEELLASLLDDYVARQQRGEKPTVEDYRVSAGAAWARFAQLVETESSFDQALAEEEGDLPREFGAYTLLRELGRGATGVVYEARRNGKTVALKVLRPGYDTSPDAIERFRREAEACARVRHDHVVEVYEAGESEGRPYYAMTFLDGRSLSAVARSGGLPPPRELARRIAKVADALHSIHEAGIVHRDVKPGNIMADSKGRMVLADFGLARSVGTATLTKSGEALGTPLFMSPEQLLGDRAKVDGRTDVYGLGATLYELLAGRPMFATTDWPGLVRAVLEERPAPLHEVAPTISPELSRIVMKALEKQPEDRYASAAAMRDDLLAFAEGRAVAGRPVSSMRRRLRRLRRRSGPLAIAALTLMAASYLFFTWRATVSVTTYPVADVFLDGESLGKTPLVVKVRPGRHTLVLKSAGFVDYTLELPLVWGSTATIDRILIADPNDPKAREYLARKYNLAAVTFADMPRERGGDSDGVEPLYPRGNVRAEDLTDLRIDVGPDWDANGKLEVRARGETLFSADFKPATLSTVMPVPVDVTALRPGDEFEWGFYPESGAPVIAKCRLVANAPVVERIERDLKEQHPSVRSGILARALLQEGLLCAAYRQAVATGREDEEILAVMQKALEGMGLKDTTLWIEMRDLADRLGG